MASFYLQFVMMIAY